MQTFYEEQLNLKELELSQAVATLKEVQPTSNERLQIALDAVQHMFKQETAKILSAHGLQWLQLTRWCFQHIGRPYRELLRLLVLVPAEHSALLKQWWQASEQQYAVLMALTGQYNRTLALLQEQHRNGLHPLDVKKQQ